jgi:hypothetical protein
VAIDPTTPLTPILPSLPAGTAPDSVVVAQAVARQALANATAELGQIVGRPASPQAPKTGAPVEEASQTSTQDAGHAADTSSAKNPLLVQSAQAAKPPASENRMVQAVRVAAAEAVPRQAGLAPLMAEVRAAVERPDAPPDVREAGKALLAKTPHAAEIVTPKGLRQAIERSGVLLEARMARSAAAPALETPSAPVPTNDMKAALLVFRGVLSAWLARAAPPVAGGPTQKASTPVPSEGRERTAPSPGASPAAPPSSVAPPSVSADGPAPPEAASDADRAVLPTAVLDAPIIEEPPPAPGAEMEPAEDDTIAARFGSFVAGPKPQPLAVAPERPALSPLVQLGLLTEDAAPTEPPTPDAKPLVARGYGAPAADAARSKVPPPPYAGGPMAGQKPTPATSSGDAAPADLVRSLLKQTNGALARQDLMQIASLPEPHHHEAETAETRPQGARLNLDLPFMTPQGVAVAQFEISRDGGGSGGGATGPAERTYKARFSIDIEPLGPVHALVTLTGARARVSLWAERAETIARLRAGEEALGAALRQAELTPEVAVHSGAPPTPGVSPLGHFVDQAS